MLNTSNSTQQSQNSAMDKQELVSIFRKLSQSLALVSRGIAEMQETISTGLRRLEESDLQCRQCRRYMDDPYQISSFNKKSAVEREMVEEQGKNGAKEMQQPKSLSSNSKESKYSLQIQRKHKRFQYNIEYEPHHREINTEIRKLISEGEIFIKLIKMNGVTVTLEVINSIQAKIAKAKSETKINSERRHLHILFIELEQCKNQRKAHSRK